MHLWLRNFHLLAGLFSALMVLQYGVSTMFMSHRGWFGPPKMETTEVTINVSSETATSARALARELMDKHGLNGELRQGRETNTGYVLRIALAGFQHDVEYSRATGVARVKTQKRPARMTLTAIHQQGGLHHEHWVSNAWGALVGIVSVGLILLGLSGIYLWFKLRKERVVGTVLLVLSLAYSVSLMVMLRVA
ncbi:MAG: PepSY-associated TM helix domain-containing protein [Candidatus Solibacter usitatus]|nr:PepSY-associated TM helix domain-containing protein [Candidatus Solibacter usitatus]